MNPVLKRVLLIFGGMFVVQAVVMVVMRGHIMDRASEDRIADVAFEPGGALSTVSAAAQDTSALQALTDEDWSTRSLTWPRFTVQAHLDATGRLTVREEQVMRFVGDWNGGERIFNVRFGQRFRFDRLLRVDSLTGEAIVLREGDIDAVDGYDWLDSQTLRWRSRLPDDPPFRGTVLTYVLEYAYDRILVPSGDAYVLDHEFAFRDRDGVIGDFELTLTIDSAWAVPPSFAGRWQQRGLPPGESFLVTVPLTWQGEGVPAGVLAGANPSARLAVAGGGALALLLLLVGFFARERANGRFEPLPAGPIDEAWLRQHLFTMPAEVAGAFWDMSVGPPEVAATLARLVSEHKLKSSVRTRGKSIFTQHVLHLELQAKRERFERYERTLIDKLFASGANSTNTESIRERYAQTGFDPASTIRDGVLAELERVPESGQALTLPRSWPATLALLATALVVGGLAAGRSAFDGVACLGAFGVGLGGWIVAGSQAFAWQHRVVRPAVHALRFVLPVLGFAFGLVWLARRGEYPIGLLTLVCASLLAFGFTWSVLATARSRQSPERLRLRKRLAAAREYFRHELRKPEPVLRDAWYPYLLAFGLHRQVTTWFKAHGQDATGASRASRSASSFGSASATDASSGSSWSGFGGGGGFAGAGATVAFGAAVSGMASSVSPPSSSSSGGGSSSSGGSSGGGGGGGW
jgi:hypothetical protein